jgi:hypothetical protein
MVTGYCGFEGRSCGPRLDQTPSQKADSKCQIYPTGSCVQCAGFGASALVTRSVNSTPTVSSVRYSTRHLRVRPSSRVICNMNSSGMVLARTPVICAPPFEKLLRMQGRAKRRSKSWIVAGEFHSTRKLFRRSRGILVFRSLVAICLLRVGI